MKLSNNALNFLLAQYRAIFKRAYVKGLASAVILTAALAAGQAQAKAPYLTGENDHYFKNGAADWSQHSAPNHTKDGITAGALGGNYFANKAGLEQESRLEIVSGGELTIGGDTTKDGVLAYVQKGTVAGGWAIAETGNITAQGNTINVVKEGYVSKDGAANRGVIFGAYVVADQGKASALSNKIWVQGRNTNGLAKEAATNGLIGGKAIGVGSASANANEVHVYGEAPAGGTKAQYQVLGLAGEFDVIGGFASTKDGEESSGGTYEASSNIVDLQYVKATEAGASDKGLTIAGARVAPSGTGTFNAVASGNQVNLTGLNVATASGSESINIFGAWSSKELLSGSVAMSQNSITLADSTLTNDPDYTGIVSVVAATAQGNKSEQVSLTDNKVTLSDSVNAKDKPAVNTLYATKVVGARLESTRQDANKKVEATLTGNSVDVQSGVVLTLQDAGGEGFIAGADILVSGDKVASVNADNNSVTIAGDVKGSVYATRFENTSSGQFDDKATLSFLNNDVTLKTGSKVQSGSLVGGSGKDSAITIENGATYIANNTTQDIASDVIKIAGEIKVEGSNTLDISGFYKDGLSSATEYHDNLTSIAASAVIKNAGTINLFGKAVVEQGATITGTGIGSKLVVDASKGLTNPDDSLLAPENQVAGAGQGTLAIYKDTLTSYLNADKIGSATTADSEGTVKLTSGGVLELRDTTNVDLAKSFNFTTTTDTAGAIVLDQDTTNGGSIVRGNELTISQKLAENAVKTSEHDTAATTYEGLSGATTDGLKIEANVLHLGASGLESWQSEEIEFASATFRDQITFAASQNGQSGTKAGVANQVINDGYHLVSEVIGDHYKVLQGQGESLADVPFTYYEAQDGVIEGDVTAMGPSGTITIRNGNYTADNKITIASGGTLTVGGPDGIDHSKDGQGANSAPDATLTLGQALVMDLSTAGEAKVSVAGRENNQRYDAETAAETLGDDRHVVLDLRKGITLKADASDDIQGKASFDVTSGGEILLTGSNLTALLAQNNNTDVVANNTSGAFFTASSGGAFVVEGDVDARFGDFNATGSTHGISLADKGFLVADSLTIDNSGEDGLNTAQDESGYTFKSVDWGDGTVAVQDLEISDLQLTNGESKPADANSYASYVTLAQGTAEIGSSLLSYNNTLKLGDADSSGNLVFFSADETAEGTINVNNIQVDQGSVAAANGVWNGSNTNLILSGANTSLAVGDGAGGYAERDYDEEYSASLTLDTITMTGEGTAVNVNEDGHLKATSLSMAASSKLKVDAYGAAEFDQVDFSALATPADGESGSVYIAGYLKINGDTTATTGDAGADDPRNGVAFGKEGSIAIAKNGTLEFGLDAVNGAILDTTSTKTFNGASAISLAEGYGKIANDGGTLKLDFESGTVFDGDAIKALKTALFTTGSLTNGVLNNGGILNIADGRFEGITVSELTGEGLSGYTATWDNLKSFSDVYGNDVTNDTLIQTNVSAIKVDDNVQGHWGSLSMASGVSTKAQVNLVGDTSLNYAAGNNGFFISTADHKTALGAKVAGHRTLSLIDGGKIGAISLSAAEGNYEEETVLEVKASPNNATPALTTIAEIKGDSTNSKGYADGTVANFYADAEVTGDITGIEVVEAFTGADLKVQNTNFVQELSTQNGNITVANKAQFGDSYVFGGSITAQNAEMLDTLGGEEAELVVINSGLFKVTDTLTAHDNATIRVGVDTSTIPEANITLDDDTVAGGTGYFEVGTLELNGGTLIVDPEYTEATSVGAVGKFKDGKQSYAYDNDKGILNGDLLIGKNAAMGIGATVAETEAAIADFKVGQALDQDKYGSILYLNGQLDVTAGSHIALNSAETTVTDKDILSVNIYNVSQEDNEVGSVGTDRYAALGLGKNTAILMTNQAFEDAEGNKTGTAIYFDRTNAAVAAGGGEIILAGDFDLSDNLHIFQDKDAAGQEGVDIKGGKITVKTLNGFLYTILEGDNQGYNVSLDVDTKQAYNIMSEASDPVVATLIAYGVGVTGGVTPPAPEEPTTPPEDNTGDQGTGGDNITGGGNGADVGISGGNNSQNQEQVAQAKESVPMTEVQEPATTTASTAKSSFLERVIVNTHGAPAEQAARLGAYGGTAQVGLAASNSNADVLASRFGIGANAQSLNLASNGMGGTLWVAPIYKSQDSDGFAAQGLNYGVDFDLYGVALGGDYKVTNEITVGAMFNVGSGDLDGQGNTAAAGVSNDFDYFGFGLYGAYQAGALTVTADLSYTQVDNDLEGNNELGKVSASADTTAWSLGVTGQYQFTFASIDVTPHAGLRFTSLDLDDYGVNAAGHGTVANFDSDTMSVFSIPVGVTFAKSFQSETWTVTPALDLQVTGQFGDDEAEGSVSWNGTGLSTNVTSEVFDNFTYGATVGVEAQSVSGFSFGLGLGYTGSSNVDEFSAQANARFTF